ncbi:MAG: A/G-specific adenine glycosylase [Actinomycetales bacterium]|nr:A/G-specific adenine glycosylase [Actinomycetales bacterium]
MPHHPLHEPVLAWYAADARDLPWRRPGRTPWGVLVSEVMLQQTPVSRVLPAWTAWTARWPDPAALAAEPAAEAIRMWDRLGYPRRALRLHEAAGVMVDRHGGEVPRDHADLLALPGVGAYTAAAVASFAFGQRHPVVDTNVRRLLARAVTGEAQAAPSLTAAETRLAGELVPDAPGTAARWAVAAMELGALVCTARSPRCGGCPVRDLCRWRRLGAPEATGPRRRAQGYAGTDRYVRGLLLAALRSATAPLTAAALVDLVPDAVLRDPLQRDRALDGLVADGLVDPLPRNRFQLPGLSAPTVSVPENPVPKVPAPTPVDSTVAGESSWKR